MHLGDRVHDDEPDGLIARLVSLLLEEETAKDVLEFMGSRAIGLWRLSLLHQFELEVSVLGGKEGVKAGTRWV